MPTKRQQQRLLDLYAAVLACDDIIIRCTKKVALFEAVCDILVASGGLQWAWIGLLDSGDQRLWPQAHSGEAWNSQDWLRSISEVRTLSDQGMAGAAVAQGRAIWSDAVRDATPAQARAQELRQWPPSEQWHSAAAIPLFLGEKACGVLSVYSQEASAFDDRTRQLLLRLADNISAALQALERAAQRELGEFALMESEVRYNALFASNPMPMLVIDPSDGRVVDANIRAMNFYGWDHSTITTQCVQDINVQTPEESREAMARSAAAEGSPVDSRHLLANGEVRDVEAFTSPLSFKGQTYLVTAIHDVTGRYHAEERTAALLRINVLAGELPEKELLTAGLELAEKLTDSNIGFLHFVNEDQETLELVTWTAGALQGCTAAYDTHYPVSQAGIWADSLRTRSPAIFNDYASQVTKNGLPPGHAHMTRLISVPVLEGGLVRLMLGVGNKATHYDRFDVESLQLLGNDLWRMALRGRLEASLKNRVDELVQVNQRLSDMQLQLLQSEKMASIGQLASGVAHEINNPIGFVKSNLGSLAGYVKSLVDIVRAYEAVEHVHGDAVAPALQEIAQRKKDIDYAYLVDDVNKLIDESIEGVQRVSQIVADLKNFSRSGEAMVEPADLQAGIESTINVVWNQLKYKVDMVRDYVPLPLVSCVASQINQVVMNLLTNAEQAITGRGTITVRTGREADRVWFEVQDTGCGIAPDKLARIFEPFYTSKPVGQGTGLGLSISFGIVQRHGGSISVKSAPGAGSTFRVTLPVSRPMTAEVAP